MVLGGGEQTEEKETGGREKLYPSIFLPYKVRAKRIFASPKGNRKQEYP